MQRISIHPRFFQGEKRNYSNWRRAMVRELLQNVIDAKSSCVEFTIKQTNETQDEIICRDNGIGMPREVLENVYLAMGETTKADSSTVGGFGKARILTCWAQDGYSIKSHDYICEGCGGDYEITPSNTFVKGCEFRILTEHHDWAEVIKSILARCGSVCEILINGELFKDYSHRGRFVRDFTFGKVYVNKTNKINRMDVRVNGAWMFSKTINAPAQVFVEIDSDKAREVLTSNRDGLNSGADKELETFLRELASETMSALKPKVTFFKQILNKGIGFWAKAKKQVSNAAQIDPIFITGGAGYSVAEAGIPCVNNIHPKLQDPVTKYSIIVNESFSPDVAKIARQYAPVSLDPSSTKYKLLQLWNKVCELVVAEYIELSGGELQWGAGFIFHDSATAQYRKEEGVNYLLINPIDANLKIRFKLNDRSDICEIIGSACHEVAHIASNCHDEIFASVFGALTKQMMKKLPETLRILKETKANKSEAIYNLGEYF